MSTETVQKRRFAEELKVRTNPHYDHNVDPSENEVDFWNPVSATNDLIKVANATLELTAQISRDMTLRLRVKTRRKQVEHDLEQFERALLVAEPPSAAETKTNKLVAAAVERRAKSAGTLGKYHEMLQELTELSSDDMAIESRIDRAQLWLKTAERLSDNIKTALSFYKDERRNEYSVRA